jgi:hypothetical protein
MFLSKIWFILVGLLAGVAVTAAFVAPRPADRRIEQLEGQRMDRAQYAAEQILNNDARRWIDYVSKLGIDGKVIDALDGASRVPSDLRIVHDSLRSRLRELVPDRQAIGVESLIAVDAKGREVVADALRGYLSDDVWGAGNRLRRIGAAPVLSKSHDRIVGALVVAVETGKRLVEMWKRNLGVEVAIVLRKQVLSSTLPEALLTQLPETIRAHAAEIDRVKRTHALPVYMGNERLLMVAAPFVGEAGAQHAYYVLLTKKSPESDPWALLSSTSSDDLKWGRFPWLSLGGGILGIIAIGLILQRKEVDGPLKRLRTEVHHLAKQELHKIDDTRYGGKLGAIARDINAALEHYTHAPLPKSETARKDISAILDPKAASADGKSFDVSQTAPAKAAVPPPAAMAASLFGTPKAVPGLGGAPPVPPPIPMTPVTSPVPFTVPAPSFAPLAPAGAAAGAAGAHTPTLPPPAGTREKRGSNEPDEADLAHFRQIFDEYVELRQKCGESIAGLSIDKFTAKLQSNREQLVSKHGCRTARFSVYEKDGKAAIRAMPVKG